MQETLCTLRVAGMGSTGLETMTSPEESPGRRGRDETIKRRLYERSGVEEYWIVDPETDVVRVYRREAEAFGRVAELSREAGDVLTTSLLPGLELPLSRIFRDRDEY